MNTTGFMEKAISESEGYREYTDAAIEQNRKGNFTLSVSENIKSVSYKLIRHDFDFGCNIFMMDQYDSKEQNETYLSLWKDLFNTAVVPLYWEGTEPKEGILRYDDDNGMDIYRRPYPQKVLDYCKENSITPKGHPLFWHEFIPTWLPKEWNKLLPLIEKRFKEISEKFGHQIPVFDLVNEPSRIWDMGFEHKSDGYFMVSPPSDYLDDIFALGEKYFPNNELILNDTVGASFSDFRGIYSGYYQLIARLIGEGKRFDKIGLQCHTKDDSRFKNVFCADRYKSLLDIYSDFGKDIVLSEISILSAPGEELQAKLAEQLYRQSFACDKMSGIFWWNLDDNGILCQKNRTALGENLPSAGLVTDGKPKLAYTALKNLIKKEWHTEGRQTPHDHRISFRGFYGTYEITATDNAGKQTVFTARFLKKSGAEQTIVSGEEK